MDTSQIKPRKRKSCSEADPPPHPAPPDAAAETPANVGTAWTVAEEQRLYDSFATEADIRVLARRHGRTPGGIQSRLVRLGLLYADGRVAMPRPPFTPSAKIPRSDGGARAPGRAAAALSAGATAADAQVLALLAALGPARRAMAIEVIRGLAAREAAEARAARPGSPAEPAAVAAAGPEP